MWSLGVGLPIRSEGISWIFLAVDFCYNQIFLSEDSLIWHKKEMFAYQIRIEFIMKLTTSVNFSKSKPLSKVATLKSLIQQAASESNSNSITCNLLKSSQFNRHEDYPKVHKKKTNISAFFEDKENCHDNRLLKLKDTKLNKSTSALQGLKNMNFGRIKDPQTQRSNHESKSRRKQPLISSSLEFKHKLLSSSSFKAISIKDLSKRNRKTARNSSFQLNIDQFELGKKIGKGRFGSVYIAQDVGTKFVIALKIINKKQLKQAKMEDQLLSEIKLQMYMRHPNILKMYGFFTDQKNIYLMLQLAENCLFNSISSKEGLQEKQAAYYTKQTIEALKYMHSQSIIHRDIKPENILVSYGVAKIGDFGWSVYSPIYKRQTFCGTLDYVSPEIVQGEFYDEKSDIWSLGVLIYEFVTGQAPFQSDKDEDQTFNKIINGDMDFPDKISHSVKEVISCILIKNPKKRLTLKEIDQCGWLKGYQKEGRFINPEIWNFWMGK